MNPEISSSNEQSKSDTPIVVDAAELQRRQQQGDDFIVDMEKLSAALVRLAQKGKLLIELLAPFKKQQQEIQQVLELERKSLVDQYCFNKLMVAMLTSRYGIAFVIPPLVIDFAGQPMNPETSSLL